jgi:signal transduction histidine kinase
MESEALRALARQMAAVADSGTLLRMLCEAAAGQCEATGAAIVQSSEGSGQIVAACGDVERATGVRIPLRGPLMRDVLVTRDIVDVDDFASAARTLALLIPGVDVGPMLIGPLLPHNELVGALVVTRPRGSAPFTERDKRQLRVVADHASLAVWKAQLLDQAQAADQAKARFLATISHELRTPLTALTGYEELLADAVLGPLTTAQADVIERMRSVTHHLTAMIEEVLAYSSLEIGREEVRPTEFLAEDLMRAAVAVIDPLARQKQLDLECIFPPAPTRMSSDIDKVRQILVNLAGNAVKFTDRGTVRIELTADEAEVRFAVSDTGIGIASGDANRLFNAFTQLDTSLTRRHGGTGLGLYISRRLAELLAGRIELRSAPGRGSEFTLVLPRGEGGR